MLAEGLRSRVEGLTAVHLTGTKMRGGDDPDLLLSTFAADHSAAAPRMRVRAGTIS